MHGHPAHPEYWRVNPLMGLDPSPFFIVLYFPFPFAMPESPYPECLIIMSQDQDSSRVSRRRRLCSPGRLFLAPETIESTKAIPLARYKVPRNPSLMKCTVFDVTGTRPGIDTLL